MRIEKKFEKMEKFEEMSTLDRSMSVLEKFFQIHKRKTGAREVQPEKTVGTLYLPVSPNNSTGTDGTEVYRTRVRVNVATYEKE